MTRRRRQLKLLHEGLYAAEVEVEFFLMKMGGHPICRWMMLTNLMMCETPCAVAILKPQPASVRYSG